MEKEEIEKKLIKQYGINPKEDNLIGFAENYKSNGKEFYVELFKHNDTYYIVTENYFDYTGNEIINGNTDSDSWVDLPSYFDINVTGKHIYILDFCFTSFISTLLQQIFEDYLYDCQTEDEIDIYKYNPQELVDFWNDYFNGSDFIDDFDKDSELREIFSKEGIKY